MATGKPTPILAGIAQVTQHADDPSTAGEPLDLNDTGDARRRP